MGASDQHCVPSGDGHLPGVTPEQGTVVAGVGDEVLAFGGCSFALLLGLVALYAIKKNNLPPQIHPEQAGPVEGARREMGIQGERREEVEGEQSAEVENCPICREGLTHAVETNCGHRFCAQCILTYWQYDQWPSPARCAVCRRQVMLLIPSASLTSPQAQQLSRQVTDYNHRMSGQPRPFLHYLYDVPTLLRHIWRNLFTLQGLVMLYKLHILFILLLLLLYFLSPLDLIPEAVFGVLGFIDDFIIIMGVLVYISLIFRAHIANGGF